MIKIPDGPIYPGDESRWGWTDTKFSGYLYKRGDVMYVSVITSLQPDQGHLSKLLDALWEDGFTIKVPTPSTKMREILQHKRFELEPEWCEWTEENAEVWVKGKVET